MDAGGVRVKSGLAARRGATPEATRDDTVSLGLASQPGHVRRGIIVDTD